MVALFLAPLFALFGAWVLLRLVLAAVRWARTLPRLLADEVFCPLGHANAVADRWKCGTCAATYVGNAWRCAVCGAGTTMIACGTCGVSVRSPGAWG